MSDTPETDYFENNLGKAAEMSHPALWSFARKLERERDKLGWLPINSAPIDGTEIIVYCPPAHGLPHMVGVCSWHKDARFCVCELREPTLWVPLPNSSSPTTNQPK